MRMPYASAYGIRNDREPTMAGPGARADRRWRFLAYSLPPYFTGGTRVPATFALHYPLLVGHVMFASVAMVSAVAQIWPGLRDAHPASAPPRRTGLRRHRDPGRGVRDGHRRATPFGPILAVSNVLLASLWLWFTSTATSPGAARRFARASPHMVRSATLALSIITNRIWTPMLFITLQPLQDSVFGGNEEHFLWVVAGIGAGWAGRFRLSRRAVVADAPTRNAAVVNFSAAAHIAGVISGRYHAATHLPGRGWAMATEFNGKIELDIRDSEPDWGPYAAPTAPEGAPNVLYLVWDDTGIATWDCFGGLVEMPTMSRIAERGVRLSQFHTTALCSPTRASLLTGRNATTVGMATIEEFTDGFPNCNGRIPADTALLSEVLAEQRLQHLLRRQVAPDAAGGVQSGVPPNGIGRCRAGSSGSTASWAARPTSGIPTWSTTTTRCTRRPPRRRAITCRRTSPTRRSSSSATPR